MAMTSAHWQELWRDKSHSKWVLHLQNAKEKQKKTMRDVQNQWFHQEYVAVLYVTTLDNSYYFIVKQIN